MGFAQEYRTPADWDLKGHQAWSIERTVELAKTYVNSEEFGHDHLCLLWLSLQETEPDDDYLRLGQGVTVSSDFVRARARMRFFWSLRELLPSSTADLVNETGLNVVSEWAEAMGRWAVDVLAMNEQGILTESSSRESNDTVQPYFRALLDHIAAWQRSLRLLDPWITRSAMFILTASRSCFALTEEYYDGPLSVRNVAVSVHDGLSGWSVLREDPPMRQCWKCMLKRREISIGDLKSQRVPSEGEYPNQDVIGWFDTRTDTVTKAIERLMPKLEEHLIATLERIEQEDRAVNDAISPVTFRSPAAFDWLVRYQVLGESRNGIALADGKDRAHVTREVNRLAALIGLTLRKERGGRPGKPV